MQGPHETRTLGAAGRSDAADSARRAHPGKAPYPDAPPSTLERLQNFWVRTMDFSQPVSCAPRGAGCQDPLADGTRGATLHVGILGLPWASVPGFARDGGRRRVPPELGTTLIAITVVILVESLIGHTWTVLGFCLALGIAASQKVGHRLLFIASAATLAANTLVLPTMFRSVSDSSVWAWLPLWCLEGLLINWLLVELLKEIDTRQAAGAEALATTTAEEAALISADLLEESSSQCQERFRLMVESIADYAIVMLGPDGRVKSWNLGAERILGYSADEVLGPELFGVPLRGGRPAGTPRAQISRRRWRKESSRSRGGDGARTRAGSGRMSGSRR